jgi:hypothetical protein
MRDSSGTDKIPQNRRGPPFGRWCAVLGWWIACLAGDGRLQAAGMASSYDPAWESWLKRSFVEGREYFVLRSGRTKMMVQSDRSDPTPAFLYLLFDAQNNRQTGRKERAYNFESGVGFVRSGLEVVLGGHAFTAWGHQTRTQWVWWDGVPAVEARWWAGGIQVTERIVALEGEGCFLRSVDVTPINLGGPETVDLRFLLPSTGQSEDRRTVARRLPGGERLWLQILDGPGDVRTREDRAEVTAIPLQPGETATVQSLVGLDFGASTTAARSGPAAERTVRTSAPEFLDAALARTRQRWRMSSRLQTDDRVVADLFDRVRVGLPSMVAETGVMDAGMFEYGAQWVRDTSNTAMGLLHTGHFELARQALSHVLTFMVSAEGNTMIAGRFEDPDREQFDQMGELLLALKAHRDWTGDASLLREHREKLVSLVERPLRAAFRGEGGLVHNRREFWERTLEDGYELAYQAYVIAGLRAAADLGTELSAAERAPFWRAEADRMEEAVLRHPRLALVDQGRLIKRRTLTGERAITVQFPASAADVPLKTERVNLLEPDSSTMLPLLLGVVAPDSRLGRATVDAMEGLWEARWWDGGYERYHSSGQCDQPGPWTFASGFILRAQHDAGFLDRSRRTLSWLHAVPGGRTGAWFEEIPIARSQAPTAGILPWSSAEIGVFVVRHLLGVRFEGRDLIVKPAPFPGQPPCVADLRFRDQWIHLVVSGSGAIASASLDGRDVSVESGGGVRLPEGWSGGTLRIVLAAP